MKKCIYCTAEIAQESVIDFCHPCGISVWGEKMFKAIVENMESAHQEGHLYQGSVTDTPQSVQQPKESEQPSSSPASPPQAIQPSPMPSPSEPQLQPIEPELHAETIQPVPSESQNIIDKASEPEPLTLTSEMEITDDNPDSKL